MALKPGRKHTDGTDISYFMNQVAERGRVVIFNTASASGLGEAMDDSNAIVQMPTGLIGEPAGVLMNDVVNLDLTRTHLNQHQDEVQLNGKVTVLRNGYITTNLIVAGDNPVAGNPAHWTTSGEFTSSTTTSRRVGQFMSSRDSDGYVKVGISIQAGA